MKQASEQGSCIMAVPNLDSTSTHLHSRLLAVTGILQRHLTSGSLREEAKILHKRTPPEKDLKHLLNSARIEL